ncbi:hypothetical protein [Amycolatopsis samaneae]|uniref:Uncharacterized protein n=1 Tax=Amycolatopsis samaneae TaxID=664691 RepID=A0ABW5GW83_9PSEU
MTVLDPGARPEKSSGPAGTAYRSLRQLLDELDRLTSRVNDHLGGLTGPAASREQSRRSSEGD